MTIAGRPDRPVPQHHAADGDGSQHSQEDYSEVTPAELDGRRRAQACLRAVQQLRQLGFEVTLTTREVAV
jgi:hypothetical protein